MAKAINIRSMACMAIMLCVSGVSALGQRNVVPKEVAEVTTTKVVTTTVTRIEQEDTVDSKAPLDSLHRDGRYVWMPDSLLNDYKKLIKGHSRVVDDPMRLDIHEMTVFRGDTIPMVLKTRNLGRYDRGLFNMLFIPRGTWHFGLTVSYGQFDVSNMGVLNMVSDIDVGAHTFNVKPYLSYFIRNNLSVGLRLGYTTGRLALGSMKVDIDEDMNFNLHDILYKSESYAAALTLQQYYGLTRRGRFGVYNEVELAFSSGSSDFERPFDGVIKRTHTTNMEAKLTFSPGVCVFIMENVSFNLSFGVFGFYLRNERQKVDDVDLGNRFTSGANFKINLFNLAFGIGIHI
ncbi:MAG: hypothetical protein K2H86_00935 [Muribaculaceae bacterium]|nr:hypothetical protein [Muribaculaceae bacterium]